MRRGPNKLKNRPRWRKPTLPPHLRIGVYLLWNCVSTDPHDCYVGQSTRVYDRINSHRKAILCGCHPNHLIRRQVHKYGPLAFDVMVFEICHLDILNHREHFWINKLKPKWNTLPGKPKIWAMTWESMCYEREIEECRKLNLPLPPELPALVLEQT